MKHAIGLVCLLIISGLAVVAQTNASGAPSVTTDWKVTVTLVRWPYT